MASLSSVLSYTVGVQLRMLGEILRSPLSPLARRRLFHASEALSYPFFGARHVELSELLHNDDLVIRLGPVKARPHNTTVFELVSLASLVADRHADTIFEIGTFDGRTTRAMAMNLATADGRVYTLNLPPETSTVDLATDQLDVSLASKVHSGARFLATPEAERITQLWGDSATFDFSPFQGRMDMVFIDGAHSEQYVERDTESSLNLIKRDGGFIVWHDAHLYGVRTFLERWISTTGNPVYFVQNTTLAVLGVRNGRPTDFVRQDGRSR